MFLEILRKMPHEHVICLFWITLSLLLVPPWPSVVLIPTSFLQQNCFIQMRRKRSQFSTLCGHLWSGTGVAMFSWPTINQSFSQTFFYFSPSQKPMWLERPSSKAHSVFFSYSSRTFITLSFTQHNLTPLPNQQKFSKSWKLNSSAPEIFLITSNSQCDIWIILHWLRETRKIASLYFL